VALFQHCCSTVAGHRFTILTLVHQPSLNYKREADTVNSRVQHTEHNVQDQQHTTFTDRALVAHNHIQRLGTLSLSRPKLVPPTTSPCGHIEHLPELDVWPPLGAWTSIILVSLSPTIQIRRTKHTKIYLSAVSNLDRRRAKELTSRPRFCKGIEVILCSGMCWRQKLKNTMILTLNQRVGCVVHKTTNLRVCHRPISQTYIPFSSI
jgi:hypothetical protein